MTKAGETVEIGRFSVDVAQRLLVDETGDIVGLRPQSAHVLAVLADNSGALVTKDALMERVWPETFVTDDSLVQCVSEIRKALGDEAGRLKTVPKRGYRLEASGAAAEEPSPSAADAPTPAGRGRRTGVLALAVAVLCLAVLAVVWLMRPEPTPQPGDGPMIAVLPFRNLSGDPGENYLAGGIAEDLTVSLSRLGELGVVSQSVATAVAAGGGDLREMAQTLGADYLVEGSVRRVGDRLRLSASLVDGETGANRWAAQYDGRSDELIDFQEDVIDELTRILAVRLSPGERARLGIIGTEDVEAYDAYLVGRELENLYTDDTNVSAEAALAKAVRLDPDFALAWAHLSQVYSFRAENRWTDRPDLAFAKALEAGRKAVELDPELPFAHLALGRLYTRSFAHDIEGATETAIAELEKAIELDPNYLDAYVFLANVLIFDGRAEEAMPLIEEGLARHPVPPFWYHLAEGLAAYYTGDYERAEAALVRARDQNPTAPFPHRHLIPTYGQLGRIDDAEWATMEYEALGREATVSAIIDSASVSDPTYREMFADGLRKAGLPEN